MAPLKVMRPVLLAEAACAIDMPSVARVIAIAIVFMQTSILSCTLVGNRVFIALHCQYRRCQAGHEHYLTISRQAPSHRSE